MMIRRALDSSSTYSSAPACGIGARQRSARSSAPPSRVLQLKACGPIRIVRIEAGIATRTRGVKR
jgi:hypothetical protein